MRAIVVTAVAVLAACAARVRADAPVVLTPADFGYGIELEVDADAAVQTLLLPLDPYRRSLRGDLADLRVFNARDEQVPHALRVPDQPEKVESGERAIAIFPIFEPQDGPAVRAPLTLHVERSAAGEVIDIRSWPRAAPPARERIAAYILDTSDLPRAVVALRLAFEPAAAGFSLPVSVEAGEDLARFRTLVGNAVVAQLEYEGRSLHRDRVELPATRSPFMRLTWSGELPARLAAVHAELADDHAPAPRERRRVRGRALASRPGTYEFDLGGPLPVERVRVLLPEPNALVEAKLESNDKRAEPYVAAFAGPIYRVKHQGVELASAAAQIALRRHRYFRLRVDDKGGGLGAQIPELEVEYLPDQLVFIARGPSPFLLAYGSHKATASAFDAEQLLAVVDEDARMKVPRQSVSVVRSRELSGRAALVPPPEPLPLRTYALWAVLVVSAVVLAALALRLLRKLG